MEDWDDIGAPNQNQSSTRHQSSTSRGNSKELVPATERNQAIYNQIREEQKRINLHSHVESQQAGDNRLLRPPDAPAMSRSVTNESYASSNYSGSEDLQATSPTQGSVTSGTNNGGRPPRGRRKRPLLPETRFITAVKRKLKLTCQSHRERKTAVSCVVTVRINWLTDLESALHSVIATTSALWKKAGIEPKPPDTIVTMISGSPPKGNCTADAAPPRTAAGFRRTWRRERSITAPAPSHPPTASLSQGNTTSSASAAVGGQIHRLHHSYSRLPQRPTV